MSDFIYTNNPLKDQEFLLALDEMRNKEIYARITALTWHEQPIEYIEGKITGGSINLDGTSAIRRTCSLTLVAQDIDLDSFYQGLNSKINIEIGIKNIIKPEYPEIIWFPQGIYVLTTFNSSVGINTYTINISAKDKMCLLNGDVGGTLNASIDFGVIEDYDTQTKTSTLTHLKLKDIIYNAVNVYGGEPKHNIIITDLDEMGYELLEYRGDSSSPMYLLRQQDSNVYTNMTMQGSVRCQMLKRKKENDIWIDMDDTLPGNWVDTYFSDLENETNLKYGGAYDSRVDDIVSLKGSTIRLISKTNDQPLNTYYSLHRIECGETVGYRLTDLTYPGDLISKAGETLTSILDKIVNVLGNFEYFYNLEGQFVFQKKKNNIYNNWNQIVKSDEGTWIDPTLQELAYTFYDSFLITAISHNPQLNNLKNDFSIWGERTSVSGAKIAVHYRYALDRKPTYYKNLAGQVFISPENDDPDVNQATAIKCDWRELIYQMSLDYFNQNHKMEDFIINIAKANEKYYPTGYTGYEQYYTDIQGFWRQLYNPEADDDTEFDLVTHWHHNVQNDPSALHFWFDFLGEGTSMDKYLVPTIGIRSKAVNDKDVTAIYFKETPDILFLTNEEYSQMGMGAFQTGYAYIRVNNTLDNFFKISAQGKSAHDVLEQLLYENTYCAETINITALPIYYLQPNTRIGIKDGVHNIDGEYIISRISLPLTYNGTMTITATKAADTIY